MGILESLIVAIIVIAAALFSVWRLMPDRHRLRLLQFLASRTGSNGWIATLERAARADLAKSCGGCSSNVAPEARHRRPAGPHHSRSAR
jgi:hypothetical protein